MPRSIAPPRRWLLAQEGTPDLIEDAPGALLTLVIDAETGQIWGMGIDDDAAESIRSALTVPPPGVEKVPPPDEIAVPAHLMTTVKLQLGHFARPPRLLTQADSERLAATAVITTMVQTLTGGAILSDVEPQDWAALVQAALEYLATEYWMERGEDPMVMSFIVDDEAPSIRILTTMGEAGTTNGLVIFPSPSAYDEFIAAPEEQMTALPVGTITFFAEPQDELEGVRALSVPAGWPENDLRVPMVLSEAAEGRGSATSAEVRIATIALIAVAGYAREAAPTLSAVVELPDGARATYSIDEPAEGTPEA